MCMKKCFSKRWAIALIVFLFAASAAWGLNTINYAEALQKSIYFYDANKCGPNITGGRLEWRGDCHTEDVTVPHPLGTGTMDVSGGFHDAGDHVKFGLPESYAASTLGWGYYEFKEAFIQTGQQAHMLEILKWFNDYFLRCTVLDGSGDVAAFVYMVGEGSADHNYWGPPELQLKSAIPRPIDVATPNDPASEMSGGAAASLALMALNYADVDPAYAAKCLTYAKALYKFATTYVGTGTGDGFYTSGPPQDEMAWAAVWLYVNTGDLKYIRDIDSVDTSNNYNGFMSQIIATTANTWQNIWVHCWDVVWAGVFTKLSGLFPDRTDFEYYSRWNLEYWSGGMIPHVDPADTTIIHPSPMGYAMLNTWGSARYNAGAQLCAMVFQKYHPSRTDFSNWAKGQMEYLLGLNKVGYAMEVGYGEASAQHPHHRAAHGSKTNNMDQPSEHRHTLWGALVGGPDGSDDHLDKTADYAYNEVAIDYNAAFVGALAGHYLLHGAGHQPIPAFPPAEPPADQFYADVKLEQAGKDRTQVTVNIHNESIHPPRYEKNVTARYYFSIKEMLDAGQSISDVSITILFAEPGKENGGGKVLGPFVYDTPNGVYYVELSWDGVTWYGDLDLHFGLIAKMDSQFNSNWDTSNDYSYQNVGASFVKTEYIPVYIDGERVFGYEPDMLPPPTTPPTPGPGQTPEPVTGLKAQYACGATNSTSSEIRFELNIVNSGTTSVALADFRIRYYYTKDTAESETFSSDYAAMGTTNVTHSFQNGYIELGFTSGAGTIAGGKQSGIIRGRINKTGFVPYNQADDYSFAPAMVSITDHNRITLYYKGALVWGTGPGGSTPTPTPVPPQCAKLGDVNGSGTVDIVDALMTAQYYVGLNPPGFNALCADVNASGTIDIIDSLIIAQYYVGLISSF